MIVDSLSTFYLVRHAHADWRPDENRPLSCRGREDADRVADLLEPHPISVIYSSPFCRARETVEPLAARLNLQVRALGDLQERCLGDGPFEDFHAAVEATWKDPSFAHVGGESNKEAQQRGAAVINRLLERHLDDHVVLSTHGNLLALILQAYDPSIDFTFWKSLTMPDVYRLCIRGARCVTIRRLWNENATG
jgi:2,3-bisphosphoglycerate-dependent phosphoglycerate mutase